MFWTKKRVFLTGNTGFKGSWLTLLLQQLGAEVIGYALAPPTTPSLFESAKIRGDSRWIEGDVRDLELLTKSLKEAKPDVVIHMAAQALVRESYLDPVGTYATNVMGTVNVLEAIRNADSVQVTVVVTSDKCYENREWPWGYRENEAMGGVDPYSNSKGCAELVTSAYRASFFNKSKSGHRAAIASARAGNVIGGGDWAADRLVPDIIRAILKGEAVKIRNPHSIRPWQHVLEPLSGYLRLAEALWTDGTKFEGGWNFGPADEDAQPVSHLVEKIATLWGPSARWEFDEDKHPHEAHYLKLDCSKARMSLGWRPRMRLDEALASLVEWYRGYRDQVDLRKLTDQQIHEYGARAGKSAAGE